MAKSRQTSYPGSTCPPRSRAEAPFVYIASAASGRRLATSLLQYVFSSVRLAYTSSEACASSRSLNSRDARPWLWAAMASTRFGSRDSAGVPTWPCRQRWCAARQGWRPHNARRGGNRWEAEFWYTLCGDFAELRSSPPSQRPTTCAWHQTSGCSATCMHEPVASGANWCTQQKLCFGLHFPRLVTCFLVLVRGGASWSALPCTLAPALASHTPPTTAPVHPQTSPPRRAWEDGHRSSLSPPAQESLVVGGLPTALGCKSTWIR